MAATALAMAAFLFESNIGCRGADNADINNLLLLGMRLVLILLASTLFLESYGQGASQQLDLGIGVGASQGSLSAAYLRQWQFGAKKKLEIGVGARFTGYVATNQYYTTAPAKLTSGKTGPTVIFADDIKANIDTFLIASPKVFSLNAMVSIGYRFSEKLSTSFNIDLIGFSFGGQQRGNYINGAFGQNTTAQPTSFNLLLVSDNDLGSLNSEFVGKYKINNKWSVRGGVQFLFTEYTAQSKVQQLPEPNDRFRNKSLMVLVGLSYQL